MTLMSQFYTAECTSNTAVRYSVLTHGLLPGCVILTEMRFIDYMMIAIIRKRN